MDIPSQATLLSVYLNASDRSRGKAVYRRAVETARAMHIAGASVFPVDLSYGTHRQIRDATSDYLSFDIPVTVEIVDAPERIDMVLAELDSLIVEGLVVARPVRVLRYAGASHPEGVKRAVEEDHASEAAHEHRSPATMKLESEARRVTVYVGSSDTWGHRNLATAIVEKCRELGIAGATASKGIMGFGKTSRIHRAHLLGLSDDLPERIEIVDSPDRIASIIPLLDEMVQGGLIVLEDVHVVRYLHDQKAR